jgi:hypothetical protein
MEDNLEIRTNSVAKIQCDVTIMELPELKLILSESYYTKIVKIFRLPQTNVGSFKFRFFAFDKDNTILLKYEKKFNHICHEYLSFSYFALQKDSKSFKIFNPENKKVLKKVKEASAEKHIKINLKCQKGSLVEDELFEENIFNSRIKQSNLLDSNKYITSESSFKLPYQDDEILLKLPEYDESSFANIEKQFEDISD